MAAAQTPIALPAFGNTFTSSLTRGFWFTCPVPCIITGLECPNEAGNPNQVVEVIDLGVTPPPAFPGTVTGTQLFYDNSTPAGTQIATNIVLQAGNVYCILGASNPTQGSATSANSYGTPSGPFTSSILGNPTTLTRCGTQSGIASNGGNGPMWQEVNGPIGRVLVDIVPASGAFANFTSDVTTGATPLSVNFMDQSFTSNPPIMSWAWDFENDGTVDSTLQNPTHVYTACGTYDVSLTVDDGTNPPSTTVKTAYIETDAVVADFSDQLVAPLVVQFTDTSTGPPTTWDWDLDGDGTTDSTLQNPAFAYPNTNPVNVTLTVTRLCSAPDTITKTVLPDQCLTTTFLNNNSGGADWTHLFDLDVTNSKGIAINRIDVNTSSTAAFTIDVYLCSDTYLGNEQNPDAWTLIGTASGTGAGAGTPSPMTFPAPVKIGNGDYGIAIQYNGAAPVYTNGNGANQSYSNGDLALNLGITRGTSAGMPFGAGTTFNPRVWNGTICYETCQFTGNAGYGYAGGGCVNSTGLVSELVPQGGSNPQLNTTFNVDVTNLPNNACLMITGFSNTVSSLGPLPFDGGLVGAPGCFLRASDDTTLFLLGAGGTATWSLTIPNDPGLQCVQYYQQAVVFDAGLNPAGAAISNAAALVIGN